MSEEEVLLPEYLTPNERHIHLRDTGEHPKIEVDDTIQDVKRGIAYGVYIQKGKRLISLMRGERRCPVCSEPNALTLKNGFAFVNEAYTRKYEDDEAVESEELRKMEKKGYKAIAHRADSATWLVGVASPRAVREYEEWRSEKDELDGVRKRARRVAGNPYMEDHSGDGDITKGVLLAAIYELLGADEYDARPLLDRDSVTKDQMLAVISRLQSVKIQNDPGMQGDEWVKVNEYGVDLGDVAWDIPEWVGNEGLLFDEEQIPSVWESVGVEEPD